MRTMPSLYSCEICGHSLDPNGSTVVRLVSCWIRGSGKSVQKVEEQLHRYRHEVCMNYEKPEGQQTLFEF